MPRPAPQTLKNHARYVPGYHFLLAALLIGNLAFSIGRARHAFSAESLFAVVVAIALLLMFFYMRQFPVTVQDRVIRLEMRLRMERLMPEDLMARFTEFRPAQLVALRFAGDAELPDLARAVLEGKLVTPNEIKRQIKDWQGDHLRV